jgi:hypothetical protein
MDTAPSKRTLLSSATYLFAHERPHARALRLSSAQALDFQGGGKALLKTVA